MFRLDAKCISGEIHLEELFTLDVNGNILKAYSRFGLILTLDTDIWDIEISYEDI